MIRRLLYAFCVPLPGGCNLGQQRGGKTQRFATEGNHQCLAMLLSVWVLENEVFIEEYEISCDLLTVF